MNSYILVNSAKMYEFKAKDSEITTTPFCLGDVSKDVSADNMKKTGLYGHAYDFAVDYDNIDVDDFLDIHKYLIVKNDKKMFSLIKQVSIALLTFSGSLATKYMSLNNEPYMIGPLLIDLNPAELNYYPFMIGLDKCNGSCYAVDDLSTKICVPSEIKDVNVKLLNMTTRINEAKTLLKHISCDCKCKFDSTGCNSNQKWNNDKCQWKC